MHSQNGNSDDDDDDDDEEDDEGRLCGLLKKRVPQRRTCGFVNAPLATVLRFIHSSTASAHRSPFALSSPFGAEGG